MKLVPFLKTVSTQYYYALYINVSFLPIMQSPEYSIITFVRFHPTLPLVLTGSGDRSAQIWCCDVPENDGVLAESQIPQASDEELSEEEERELK